MTDAQVRYREYLQSEHWRTLRLQAFRSHGRKCFRCPATSGLDVHHLRYRHPWTECTVEDVRPCCRDCHDKEHGIVVVVPQAEKIQTQRRSVHQKLDHLLALVRSGRPLPPKRRHFVSKKLLNGNRDERRIANEIFQINSALSRVRRHPCAQNENVRSQVAIVERLLSKKGRKRQRQIAKYSAAFHVKW